MLLARWVLLLGCAEAVRSRRVHKLPPFRFPYDQFNNPTRKPDKIREHELSYSEFEFFRVKTHSSEKDRRTIDRLNRSKPASKRGLCCVSCLHGEFHACSPVNIGCVRCSYHYNSYYKYTFNDFSPTCSELFRCNVHCNLRFQFPISIGTGLNTAGTQ